VVSSILEHTTQHGAISGKTQSKPTKYYNLDAIISVGYRVNSAQATQLRIWATNLLREFMIKGFIPTNVKLNYFIFNHLLFLLFYSFFNKLFFHVSSKTQLFFRSRVIMDDDRLKNGRYFGKDYFRELLERVRSIRTSERRIYQ